METSRPIRRLLYFVLGVCPILFFTDLTRNPYYSQIALVNILIPACWLLWLWQAWKAEEFVWVSTSFDIGLLALVGVSLLSWVLSMRAHPALIISIYSEGSKAIIFLLVNVYMVYAAALRTRETSLVRTFLWIIYLVSFVAAVYGVCQYFGLELIWPTNLNPYGSRPVSTFGNPNFMSSYLVVVIPVMAMDYLFKATGCPRAVLFLVIMTSFGALLSTLTRSSWVGLLVGMVFVYWGARAQTGAPSKAKMLLWAMMLAMVFTWPHGGKGYSATVFERLTEVKKVSQEAYGSVYQRFLIWLAAWGMVQDHPFFGKGWGCFELFYPFYQGPLLLEKNLAARTHANNSHNEILEYWSQIGTIGLGIVLWMWALFFRLCYSISQRLSAPWKPMLWGMMGGVAGMLVDNLLNVSIYFCIPAFIFWWVAGSALALDPGALKRTALDLHAPWKKTVMAICAAGLLCLMGRAFCLWMGEINFFAGFKMSKAGADLVSASRALEKAYAWHHLEVNNNYELGNVYARMGQRDKALFMYKRALDANAGYDEIYFNRATMLMQSGRTNEAMANYRVSLAINPWSHEAYNALATLYFKDIPRYGDDIERLYNAGLQLFPDDKEMWNNLGYLYTQRNQWDKAAGAYQKAIAVDPQFDLAKRNLAVVLGKMGGVTGVLKR